MRTTLALITLLAACAPARTSPAPAAPDDRFEVAILGDMPYLPRGAEGRGIMEEYGRVLADVDRSPAAFVVHVGDITHTQCADSVFRVRRAEFDALSHPLVYLFGDNEWIDCARDGHAPLERLARLRETFTAGDRSLGRAPIALERQSRDARFAALRENVRWSRGGVLFVGLHVVPLPLRWMDDEEQRREYELRNAANLAWLREAFERAERPEVRGVAVFFQANPGWGVSARREHRELVDSLARYAARFGRPVAVVHGDTHTCRVDRPLKDAQGRALANVVRAETFGNPFHHWLRMTVAPASDSVFRFTAVQVSGNPPAACAGAEASAAPRR